MTFGRSDTLGADEQKQPTPQSNSLFEFNGVPDFKEGDSLPPVVLTPEAKDAFARAQLAGTLGKDGTPTATGQGLIGVYWFGKNEKGDDIIYADLLPAFNKDDNRIRADKNGKPYGLHEHVYTDQPLGGNSGRNHEQFLEIIRTRIEKAIEENDQATLLKYKGIYTVSNGKVILDKKKMFGYGLFKHNETFLLNNIRCNSANINPDSVKYNEEFLYINYFNDPGDINHPIQKIYYLTRRLPTMVAQDFAQKLLKVLPTENEKTHRIAVKRYYELSYQDEEKTWQAIRNNPIEKNNLLHETLTKFCGLQTRKFEDVEKIVNLLKKNIKLISPTNIEHQQRSLVDLLLYKPSNYNYATPIDTAIFQGHNQIFYYLIDTISENLSTEELNFILQKTIAKGNVDQTLFIAEKIRAKQTMTVEDDKSLTTKCLKSQAINFVGQENYSEVKKIMERNRFNLEDTNSAGTSIETALFSSFQIIMGSKNITKLNEFKSSFPDLYQKFLNTPNYNGNTCFTEAASRNSFDMLKHVLEDKESKINLEIPNGNGETLLLLAAFQGRVDIIDLLLKHNASPNAVNTIGQGLNEYLNNRITEWADHSFYQAFDILQAFNLLKIKHPHSNFKLNEDAEKSLISFIQRSLPSNEIMPVPILQLEKNFPDLFKKFMQEKIQPTEDSLLHQAMVYQNYTLADYLLEKGFDANAENSDKMTPLMLAAQKGNLFLMDILVDHKADLDKIDARDKSFRYYLAENLMYEFNRFEFNKVSEILNSKYSSPYLIEMVKTNLSVFYNLIETNNHQKLQEFKKLFPEWFSELLNKQDYRENTCLLEAAEKNSFNALQYLLESKEADINLETRNRDGNTLLLLAASHGRTDVIDFLLKHGASPDVTNDKGQNITNYLNLYLDDAVKNGKHDEIFKILRMKNQFPGISLTKANEEDLFFELARYSSPILPLVELEKNYPDVLNNLLERRALDGGSLMHKAVENERPDLVEFLLETKLDINTQNRAGLTPLMLAAHYGDFNIVDLLVEHKANLTIPDKRGRTFFNHLEQTVNNKLLDNNEFKKASEILAKYNITLSHESRSKLFTIFHERMENKDFEKLKEFKESFPTYFSEFIHSKKNDADNDTIFVTAAKNNDLATMLFILRNSEAPINLQHVDEHLRMKINIVKEISLFEKGTSITPRLQALQSLFLKSDLLSHADIERFFELDRMINKFLDAAPTVNALTETCMQTYQNFAQNPTKENLEKLQENLVAEVEQICTKKPPHSDTFFERKPDSPREISQLKQALRETKQTPIQRPDVP